MKRRLAKFVPPSPADAGDVVSYLSTLDSIELAKVLMARLDWDEPLRKIVFSRTALSKFDGNFETWKKIVSFALDFEPSSAHSERTALHQILDFFLEWLKEEKSKGLRNVSEMAMYLRDGAEIAGEQILDADYWGMSLAELEEFIDEL